MSGRRKWMDRLKYYVRRPLSPEQTQSLKKVVNVSQELGLWARDVIKSASRSPAELDNLFHSSVQKTGSQWIRSVFSDLRIRAKTGLRTFPQFRYEWGEMRKRFPKYTYVPGLYISRGLYEEIEKPKNYKTIYITRDPRNTVLSWYYSMRDSHALMGKVYKHRAKLQQRDFDDGLLYCIRQYHLKFTYMRSWAYAKDDPQTYFVRLEDLSDRPVEEFSNIFAHCGIDISKELLSEVLADYTKQKMRKRDLKYRSGSSSHYRKEETDWRSVFNSEHRRVFRDVTGNLVELLGYGD